MNSKVQHVAQTTDRLVPLTVCSRDPDDVCDYPACSCALAYMPADLIRAAVHSGAADPEPHHNHD
jgi:hypothetical protein